MKIHRIKEIEIFGINMIYKTTPIEDFIYKPIEKINENMTNLKKFGIIFDDCSEIFENLNDNISQQIIN